MNPDQEGPVLNCLWVVIPTEDQFLILWTWRKRSTIVPELILLQKVQRYPIQWCAHIFTIKIPWRTTFWVCVLVNQWSRSAEEAKNGISKRECYLNPRMQWYFVLPFLLHRWDPFSSRHVLIGETKVPDTTNLTLLIDTVIEEKELWLGLVSLREVIKFPLTAVKNWDEIFLRKSHYMLMALVMTSSQWMIIKNSPS